MTTFTDPLVVWPTSVIHGQNTTLGFQTSTIDAANEYFDQYGYLHWVGTPQPATKDVTSGGGAIVTSFGTVTFANGTTNMRIGIQDVDVATGRPARGDGTYDVSADLVGGTDTVTSDTLRNTAMETGSKSIAEGQLICVRTEFTARGGADSVVVNAFSTASNHLPGCTANTGVVANVVGIPNLLVLADDGTVGYLLGSGLAETITVRTFDSATAVSDEYASLVSWPFSVDVYGMLIRGRTTTAAGVLDCMLYTTPLGTPAAQRTTSVDTDQESGAGASGNLWVAFSSPYTVPANTQVALAVRPTTATSDVTVFDLDIGAISSGANLYKGLGGTWSKGTRLDNTGAFSEDTGAFMSIGAIVTAVDSGQPFVTNTAQIFSSQGGIASGSRF